LKADVSFVKKCVLTYGEMYSTGFNSIYITKIIIFLFIVIMRSIIKQKVEWNKELYHGNKKKDNKK